MTVSIPASALEVGMNDIRVGDVDKLVTKAVQIEKTAVPEKGGSGDEIGSNSSSGGCDAGIFGALSWLAVGAALILKKRA